MKARLSVLAGLVLAASAGCTGQVLDGVGEDAPAPAAGAGPGAPMTPGSRPGAAGPAAPSVPAQASVPISGLRRLSREEYDNTVQDLLGDGARAGAGALPVDGEVLFDNDYPSQVASEALIEAAETLAAAAAARLVADADATAALVPCKPASAGDGDC